MTSGSLLGGRTPDVTGAQLGALAVWIVGQLVAYGVVDRQAEQLALSITTTALAVSWKLADAWIRGRRARMMATIAAAETAREAKP